MKCKYCSNNSKHNRNYKNFSTIRYGKPTGIKKMIIVKISFIETTTNNRVYSYFMLVYHFKSFSSLWNTEYKKGKVRICPMPHTWKKNPEKLAMSVSKRKAKKQPFQLSSLYLTSQLHLSICKTEILLTWRQKLHYASHILHKMLEITWLSLDSDIATYSQLLCKPLEMYKYKYLSWSTELLWKSN